MRRDSRDRRAGRPARLISLGVIGLLTVACGDSDAATATTAENAVETMATPATEPAVASTTTTTTTTAAEMVSESTAPPATPAPTATMTAAGFDADQQAVADAWAVVFDSEAAIADKTDHLENAAALADTLSAYQQAGSAMGGIALEPTQVAIEGTTATVTYDVYFGEAPAYTDLTGTIDLVGDTWVVPETEFCSFMASARNACPT